MPKQRYENILTAREYYDGIHDTQLTDRQRNYLQIKTGQEFNDNYCPIVVDAMAERLKVTGFLVQGDRDIEDTEDTQGKVLEDWWAINRMDATQNITHTSAVRDGDTFIIVDWDEELDAPKFSHELAYDGKVGVDVVYRDAQRGEAEYAFKEWYEGEIKRRNEYWPDRVDKYERKGGDWELIESMDMPFEGIPVVHFVNRGQGYSHGQSELRSVIPIQNALNKAIIDLLAAADTTAFRVYTMLGDDPTGLNVVPGSFLFSTKKPGEASIGHIPGEDLENLIEFKDTFGLEVARVSRTPLSYFQISKQIRAEGTLKQEEAGLVSRVRVAQVAFGNAWEDVMTLGRQYANVMGGKLEEETVSTVWADPETRNDLTQIEVADIKINKIGIPPWAVWAELGYTPDTVEEIKKSIEYIVWFDQKLWANVKTAVEAGMPLEAVLRRYGFEESELTEIGTMKMAAIQVEQEDVEPEDEQ